MTEDSTRPRFDLTHEPWIPVTTADGRSRLASLRDVLQSPDAFTGIASSVPVEFLALHRLLLAVCHRAIGPGDAVQREMLLDKWPSERLATYLDQWVDRFDLFSDAWPFMQVRELRGATQLRSKPWTQLALERSSGNAKLLFDHCLDDDPGWVDPATAARTLVAHLQFTPGGLVKALRTSGSRGPACGLQLVMPLGSNLRETLALGLVTQSASEHALDLPPWEVASPTVETLKKPPEQVAMGPAQRYTWLSRAVLLLPEADGHLCSTLYAEGLNLSDDPVPDPMSAMVPGKHSQHPLFLDAERAFWRDLHALAGEGGATPPRVIAHAIDMRAARDDFSPLELAAGGLLPDQAKIVLWRLEERRLSPALLAAGSIAAGRIDAAVKRAQEVSQALYGAVMDLCREWLALGAERVPAETDVKTLMHELSGLARYWGELEAHFWSFVDRLGRGDSPDECLAGWHRDVHASATYCWKWATSLLGTDGRALAAQAKASSSFHRALHKALQS